jgi:hypothetical protein
MEKDIKAAEIQTEGTSEKPDAVTYRRPGFDPFVHLTTLEASRSQIGRLCLIRLPVYPACDVRPHTWCPAWCLYQYPLVKGNGFILMSDARMIIIPGFFSVL